MMNLARPIKKSGFTFWKKSYIKRTESRDSKSEDKKYHFRESWNKDISDSELSELDTEVKSYGKSDERLSLEFDELDSMMKNRDIKNKDKISKSKRNDSNNRSDIEIHFENNFGLDSKNNPIGIVALILFLVIFIIGDIGYYSDIEYLIYFVTFLGIILYVCIAKPTKPKK